MPAISSMVRMIRTLRAQSVSDKGCVRSQYETVVFHDGRRHYPARMVFKGGRGMKQKGFVIMIRIPRSAFSVFKAITMKNGIPLLGWTDWLTEAGR